MLLGFRRADSLFSVVTYYGHPSAMFVDWINLYGHVIKNFIILNTIPNIFLLYSKFYYIYAFSFFFPSKC